LALLDSWRATVFAKGLPELRELLQRTEDKMSVSTYLGHMLRRRFSTRALFHSTLGSKASSKLIIRQGGKVRNQDVYVVGSGPGAGDLSRWDVEKTRAGIGTTVIGIECPDLLRRNNE